MERFFPKKSFTVVDWEGTFQGGRVLSKGNPLVFFKGNPSGEWGTFQGGEMFSSKKKASIVPLVGCLFFRKGKSLKTMKLLHEVCLEEDNI